MNQRSHLLTSSFALTVLIGSSAPPAAAQLVPAGGRIQVNMATLYTIDGPSVAIDPEGRAMVVWSALEEDPSGWQISRIYGRALRADGRPAGAQQEIDADPTEFQFYPDVAAVEAGRFIVVWSRNDPYAHDDALEAYEIFGRFTAASGRPRGAQFHVNTLTPFWQVHPAVAAAPGGDFLVAWVTDDVGDQGPWPEILGAQRFSKRGARLGRELQVNNLLSSPAESYTEQPLAVASDLSGEWMVVWGSWWGDLFARRYDRQGRPRGPEMRVDDLDGNYDMSPAVAADAEGNFVVVWRRGEDFLPAVGEIVARSFDRRGNAGSTYVVGASRYAASTSLTSDAFGHFVTAWDSSATLTSPSRIAVRQLAASGEPRGEGISIASPGGEWAGRPDLAGSPGGDLLLTWIGPSRDPEGFNGIFVQRLQRQVGPCAAAATELCLQDGRFQVRVAWRDPYGGSSGVARSVPLTDESGYFWFFDDDNVELVVKLLDGRRFNGNYWLFYGALSTVEYWVVVTDTRTGVARTYHNPAHRLASFVDLAAFSDPPAGGVAARSFDLLSSAAPGINAAVGEKSGAGRHRDQLLLNGERFRVEVTWTDFNGLSGAGRAVPLTADAGYFWFFHEDNVELVVKVLDGRHVNGHVWVFYGALSNVEYTVRVTDTVTGEVWTRFNPAGTLASVADTAAF